MRSWIREARDPSTVPAVNASELPRAVAACRAVAAACGLRVEDAVVLNSSNRLIVHLRPCDVLARVAPRARRNGADFEIEVSRRLAETDAPVATLDPRVEPRVYQQDDFVVTLWTYYETVPPHDIEPEEYASALDRLHAGMRQGGSGRRLAMVTAWRCEPADDLPNGRAMAVDWIDQLRSAIGP